MLCERFEAQGLSGSGFGDVEEVVGRVLAVQSQDRRGMLLAVRSRSSGLVASDVDRALNEGAMVVTWLNRGTLHLVLADDYPWLQAVTTPRHLKWNAKRLREEGVSVHQAEAGSELIVAALVEEGPLGRNALRDRLELAGIPVAGQAFVHLIGRMALRGLIVRGPVVDGQQQFVLVEDWLGRIPEVDIELALSELARRYLRGHGPATDRDLAKWAGITLTQARAGLKAISSELVENDGFVSLARPSTPEIETITRLLGPFDPLLHGWASRDWILPSSEDRAVVTSNGLFRPTILSGVRIRGTWKMPKGKVELRPFAELDEGLASELQVDAHRVEAFLAA